MESKSTSKFLSLSPVHLPSLPCPSSLPISASLLICLPLCLSPFPVSLHSLPLSVSYLLASLRSPFPVSLTRWFAVLDYELWCLTRPGRGADCAFTEPNVREALYSTTMATGASIPPLRPQRPPRPQPQYLTTWLAVAPTDQGSTLTMRLSTGEAALHVVVVVTLTCVADRSTATHPQVHAAAGLHHSGLLSLWPDTDEGHWLVWTDYHTIHPTRHLTSYSHEILLSGVATSVEHAFVQIRNKDFL